MLPGPHNIDWFEHYQIAHARFIVADAFLSTAAVFFPFFFLFFLFFFFFLIFSLSLSFFLFLSPFHFFFFLLFFFSSLSLSLLLSLARVPLLVPLCAFRVLEPQHQCRVGARVTSGAFEGSMTGFAAAAAAAAAALRFGWRRDVCDKRSQRFAIAIFGALSPGAFRSPKILGLLGDDLGFFREFFGPVRAKFLALCVLLERRKSKEKCIFGMVSTTFFWAIFDYKTGEILFFWAKM